jgi:predicted NUDIX family phosphoesterase
MIAIEQGIIQSSGATPAQTMKSKLSTDILKGHERSRFMRTSQNHFGLRSWSEEHSEYIAERYQKALLDEEIVVFPAAVLRKFVPSDGIHRLTPDASLDLISHTFPAQRRLAEDDFSIIQLVSQFLVFADGRIATYKRTKRLPESRLHGVHSLLFGGHLNPDDVPPLFSVLDPQVGPLHIQRELSEEVRFSLEPKLELVGVIYDTSQEVSRQHLGILYEVHTPPETDIEIGERGFLQQLQFETPAEILQHAGDFENWSMMVLNQHILEGR